MATTPAPGGPAPGKPVAGAPEKKSNVLWWVLGLTLAAVLVLGLGGLVVASYVFQNIQVQQSAGQVEVSTPVGNVKVSKDAAVDTGLPAYPGATPLELAAEVELTVPQEEGLSVTAALYRTPDPIEKVDAWYRDHLSPEFVREGPGVMVRKKDVFGVKVKSGDIAFISEADEQLRVVALERKWNGTEIALARIAKQETQ